MILLNLFDMNEDTDNILFRKHLGLLTGDIKVKEEELSPEIMKSLIDLSAAWEAEGSCHGYRKNDESDIEGNRVFIARDKGKIIGYLFGHMEEAKKESSIIEKGTPYFEVEELYVKPAYRNCKIGHRLFKTMERKVSGEAGYIMLSTATKNWKSILHFYIDELDMEFWNARLFKKIE